MYQCVGFQVIVLSEVGYTVGCVTFRMNALFCVVDVRFQVVVEDQSRYDLGATLLWI